MVTGENPEMERSVESTYSGGPKQPKIGVSRVSFGPGSATIRPYVGRH